MRRTFRQAKYHNNVVEYDGYRFDSQAEALRYQALKVLENQGEIQDLKVHPRYELLPKFKDKDGKTHRATVYEGDFEYIEKGQKVCEDVKGMALPVFKLKAKLFVFRFPDIELRVLRV